MKKTTLAGEFKVDFEILKSIKSFSHWDEKRNLYYGLTDSRSILLKYNFSLPEGIIPEINENALSLFKSLEPVIQYTQTFFGPSYCSKAMITNLPAGKTISEHVDPGWLFMLSRRFHWVIETNPDCIMKIDGEEIHARSGEIWEIDNKKFHSSRNEGNTDRIHFIFDLVIAEEALAQTPHPFESGSYDDRYFSIVLRRKQKTGKFEV